MPPVSFESRPAFKIFLLGTVASIPSVYLMSQGAYYERILPTAPMVGVLYLFIGTPSLAVALIFLARMFTKKKVALYPAHVEIRIGSLAYKVRWENIRAVSFSKRLGIGSLFIGSDRKNFWFSQIDFPNFSKMAQALQQGKAGKLFSSEVKNEKG